ncbi:MAG TPA: hypothetical protein VNQ77_02575 [Frankiaceae bacterium]|nr:hypothetical protein [Frankiaceae bacterium]
MAPRTTPVFAVIRLDAFQAPESRSRVTVKEIVRTQAEAEAEVERLNRLNGDKDVEYSWQATRLVDRDSPHPVR